MAAWPGSRFNKEIPMDCLQSIGAGKAGFAFSSCKTVWARGAGKENFIKEGDK